MLSPLHIRLLLFYSCLIVCFCFLQLSVLFFMSGGDVLPGNELPAASLPVAVCLLGFPSRFKHASQTELQTSEVRPLSA